MEYSLQLLFYSKVIENTKNGKYYYYYDEREWRYTPDLHKYTLPLIEEKYVLPFAIDSTNSDTLVKLNSMLHSDTENHLFFRIDDITHIIVRKESDIKGLVKLINTEFHNVSFEERDILLTRVISIDKMKGDF
jgi:hypothetical protein